MLSIVKTWTMTASKKLTSRTNPKHTETFTRTSFSSVEGRTRQLQVHKILSYPCFSSCSCTTLHPTLMRCFHTIVACCSKRMARFEKALGHVECEVLRSAITKSNHKHSWPCLHVTIWSDGIPLTGISLLMKQA